MFIPRTFNRTEDDDFKLNVQPMLNENNEALPLYYTTNTKNQH